MFVLPHLTPWSRNGMPRMGCVSKGMIADVGYHDFCSRDAHNPHAHVHWLTNTGSDVSGFRSEESRRQGWCWDWRQKWADHLLNIHLDGISSAWISRSYDDQGIDPRLARRGDETSPPPPPRAKKQRADAEQEIKRPEHELLHDYDLGIG